ncbi:MAG TPA: molybdopterin-synthase adenylyltransferase MoeB [Ferrovibrio sp.]|uniref:HesA/MoeB/ThiF family protein n=1 Tax=Ferrovibrio sp. TaxID=1917215 RepID=UPI002ED0F671
MSLTDDQFHRYARHLILDEVGEEGQEKLLASRILIVGAGGLGSPLLLYLAAAGVGTIGVIDDDVVELSNLQRQVIHKTASLDRAKVDSAMDTVAEINPEVRIVPHRLRLTAANAMEVLSGYDLVADGSDNFATRFLVNDACYFAKTPLVSAALLRFDGQVSTFKAHLGGDHPCYRCLFPEPPPADLIPRCEEAGILGAIAGAVGSLQAVEVLKELLGLGESLSGHLLVYDGLSTTFRKIRIKRDPTCPLCGPQATIKDLSGHG